MKAQIKNAERLHRLLSDTDGLTDAELRRMLQAENVDVDAYLRRLKSVAPATASAAPATPATPAMEACGYFEELPMAARQSQPKPNSRPPA